MDQLAGHPFSLFSASDGLHIRKLAWPPAGLIGEILRLFALDPHLDRQFSALGVGKDELAAHRYASLGRQESVLFGADDGRGLVGLLSIRPETWTSVLLGNYAWCFEELVLARGAPPETAAALLEAALSFLPEPVEFIRACVPSTDLAALRALNGAGFYTICSETVAVCANVHGAKFDGGDCRWMTLDDLHHACALARRCEHFSPLCLEQSLSPWQINGLLIRSVVEHLEDPHAALIVVRDDREREIGFAGVRRIPWSSEFVQRELAVLDLLGLVPGAAGSMPEQAVIGHLLASLSCLGIDALWTEVPMAGPQAPRTIDALRGAGFTITSNSQLLHCWLNRTWRGTSLLPQVKLGDPPPADQDRVDPGPILDRSGSTDGRVAHNRFG